MSVEAVLYRSRKRGLVKKALFLELQVLWVGNISRQAACPETLTLGDGAAPLQVLREDLKPLKFLTVRTKLPGNFH